MNTTDLSPDQKRQLLAQLLQKKRRFPLSFAQQRLWFLHQLLPGQATYNLPALFRLIGTIDLAVLTQSLEQIVQRHEILRTSFVEVNGEPFQQVHSSVNRILNVTDLRGAEELILSDLIRQEAIQPFNLENAPLLRARLFYINNSEALLLVTLHHIIADYDSLRIFIRELSLAYRALKIGQPLILPELPIQYADYAAWQRLQNEKHATQLTYWKQQLSHSNVLQIPTDYSQPIVHSSRGAKRSFHLTAEMTSGLKILSRKEEATLFMILLTAFQILLYRYTDQSDISVGSTVANRNRSEVTNLIGLFVNNLVFRTQIPDHCSVRELLQQVRGIALTAYDHQDLPYEYLVEQLQPDRHLSHNPLFQVAFVLHQSAGNEAIALPDLTLQYIESPTQTSRFDLSLDMDDTPSGLVGVFEYSTDLFKKETIDRLIEHFKILLSGIIENPDQRISELTLLTPAEQQQILVEWNDTDDRSTPSLCFHQRFEQQAQQTPDAIALLFQDSHLTYSHLNDRANQLAHYLISLDLAPEAPIALHLDRSLDLVIALLAVLKAGACYLPLDPSLPTERLAFMLSDAQAPILITTPDLPLLPADSMRSVLIEDSISEPIDNPDRPTTPAHAAYLLYTSGSTGTPKAVQILHSALSNFLHAMQQRLSLSAEDKLFGGHHPFFRHCRPRIVLASDPRCLCRHCLAGNGFRWH
ncbi:MAG: AMP-binding protein [Leptolyngbyaceae cyanobacterium CSU_1_4]|nr:AMP-binding protein [Leptolyngbyaceae cyanobacterium CSU_1_4]